MQVRFAWIVVALTGAGLILSLLVIPARLARADSVRTPAEATVHAQEELENALAQGKITRTPTPTATVTPSPTATATPAPTDAPIAAATVTPTVTPEPCWLTDQDLGDPDNGWIVFDQDGAPVPCPTDEELIVETTSEPDGPQVPTPTRRPTPMQVQAPPAQAAPQRQVVVRTVVVVVTAVPSDTPASRQASPPVRVVVEQAALPTTRPSLAPTATVIPTVTPASAVAAATSSPTATTDVAEPMQVDAVAADRGWLYASAAGCLGLIAIVAVYLARRGRRAYAP